MKNLLLATLSILAISLSADERPLRGRDIWDLNALDLPPATYPVTIPASNDYGRVEGVEPIFIEGEPYRRKSSRVFAWWGLPAGASAENKVPAMVLVHGGGGTAFAKWVKIWTDRGYAAIAMDTCGKIPQGERDGKPHPTHPWSGPSGWGSSVAQIGEPLRDQWTYHAVAAVLRCHSFLRSRPEVDAARTGLTGISWGGYLTSIAMSVDDRFKFAAPVYGCGWYDLNPQWNHMNPDRAKYQAWLALWDPKNYFAGKKSASPVLWCAGTNDRWYPLDALYNSTTALPAATPLLLSIKLKMPHGHPPAGDPKEITALADQILKRGAMLPVIHSAEYKQSKLTVSYHPNDLSVKQAQLLYTCSTNSLLMDREWKVAPIADFNPAGKTFTTSVPQDVVMFFANIITDGNLVFSTRIFTR